MEYRALSAERQTAAAKWLWWGVALGLAVLVAAWAFRSWLVLTFPYQVEYGEGPVLDWVNTLLRGRWPYTPIQQAPWTFSVYAPGYLLVAAALTPFAQALGASVWAAGRFVSLLSALGLAGIVVLLVRDEREPSAQWTGWVAAGLWLASPYLTRWATFYRPDLLALFWSAVGIFLVTRARGRHRILVAAALAFVAGVYTKQSFFAAPLAAALYLYRHNRRAALTLAGVGAVVGGIVAVLLFVVTDGAVIENLIVANANPFDPEALWRFELAFVRTVPIVLALAVFAVWRRRSLVGLWFVLALVVTVTAGKAGAWENYFLEPLLASIVLAGRVVARRTVTHSFVQVALPALLLLQIALYLPGFERLGPAAERGWLAELRGEEIELASVVARTDDPILSEHMGVLAQQDRPIPLHSFVYTQLERQGIFDPAPLVATIRSHAYPLVIERTGARVDRQDLDRWSQTVLNAIEASYAPADTAGRWLLLRPFSVQRTRDAALDDTIRLARWDVAAGGEQAPSGPVTVAGGDELEVHLLWEAVVRPDADLTAYVHLVDWRGTRLTQSDAPPRAGTAPTSRWDAGDLVHDVHTLVVPADAQPGAYSLDVGMYAQTDQGIRPAGSPIRLHGLKVPLVTDGPAPSDVLASVGEALSLRALEVPDHATPGEMLTVRATWHAERTPDRDLTSYLHLAGPCEEAACRLSPMVQDDHRPLDGRYPTSVWSVGETVATTHVITMPADAPPGDYVLRLGWYDATSGTREPMRSDSHTVVDDALTIPLQLE